ncbi:TetR/AcrR family transcriptional regulator [Anaerocolumna xylanovorans]|uniref:Transcriptional regulator, TetR family n=1 Tax=Anaerocolumna xylanovorans DSM 12503 TaxID=1121345 RepID=A0A1M7XY56_9FIRM|nr:TetR/AcrR family transcriptional regulator [Anaerocolumna xylanovorans]SHO43955.1 transcriptional regulator, TetR family [Anaerocolumna xylanovorans DSM 12503]
MRELKSVEEKILDRALYLIGKNRSLNISIRAISKEAGVNVSAINYYFRTKEEMLRQAKELYVANTLSITAILENGELGPEEKFLYAANEIMEYIIRYPGIDVLLRDAREKDDEISVKVLKVSEEMTEGLNHILDSLLKGAKDISCKHIIFWSAINYPVEDNPFMKYSAVLNDRKNRMAYIKLLLAMLRQ